MRKWLVAQTHKLSGGLYQVVVGSLIGVFALGVPSMQAQTIRTSSRWGPDSLKTRQNLSIYYSFMQEKKYEEALPYWRYVFYNAPCVQRRPLQGGIQIFEHLISQTTDEQKKQAYVDTILLILDTRTRCFPQELFGDPGHVAGLKAYYLYRYRRQQPEPIYREATRSIRLMQAKTSYSVLPILMWSALTLWKANQLPADSVLHYYLLALSVIEANRNGNYGKYYASVEEQIQSMILKEKLIQDCQTLTNQLDKQLASRKHPSLTLWKQIYSLLRAGQCTNTELFQRAARILLDSLHDASAGIALARVLYEHKQCQEAIATLEQAVPYVQDTVQQAKIYLQAAQWTYQCLRNFPRARQLAEKSLRIHPSFGLAYLFIGDLYSMSSTMCKENLDAKAVYWLAIDMYQKAMEVDPSVREQAIQRIARAKPHTPSKEEGFFHLLKEGDTYTVKCWINRSTRVRFYH